jgi:triphosphoribosyl-dephospho-CoA synthase
MATLDNNKLSIHSLDDVLTCINLASTLEIAAWPKPGNVHRTLDFESTRFEHFLAGISAIVPSFKDLCTRIDKKYESNQIDFSFVNLGEFYVAAANRMMSWQKGGNILLGHILILAPLAASAVICLKQKALSFKKFKENIKHVINNSTPEDTILLYKAIRHCNPGGMGKIEKYDLYDENSLQEIKLDNINLKKIFSLSRGYDLISSEYASGFQIVLTEGYPYFIDTFNESKDINLASVNTFLKILANHNDTLIIRKSGESLANEVSLRAKEILKMGGLISEKGKETIINFDNYLQLQKGQLNPGTTADLLAGVLFIALLFGLRY